MNESARRKLLSDLDEFEASPTVSAQDVQLQLQHALAVWEGSTASSEYKAIDLAENSLEQILHARLLEEQRDEARACLKTLREQLSSPGK